MKMKLRILKVYDRHGRALDEALQYWDEEYETWLDVPCVRCSESDYETINEKPKE